MPEYKVLENGFYGGVFRVPGGRHDPVKTSKPIKKVPSWLELIKDRKTPKQKAAAVNVPNEKVSDFMGDKDDKGVTTL